MTFRELDAASARCAAVLVDRGIGRGDRVLVLARPSTDLYAAVIGILRVGATAVFLDRRLLRGGALGAIEAAAPKAIVGSAGPLALRRLVPGLGRVPVAIALNAALRADRPLEAIVAVDAAEAALITFSGGTGSGSARAVVRTHGTLSAQHRALAQALPARDGDVDYTAFPMVTLHNLASGVTTVLPARPLAHPERLDPSRILGVLERHGVTTASAAPTFWQHMAEGWRRSGATADLRRIAIGGAPLPPRLAAELTAVAPGAEIVGVYGSTEAEPVAILRVGTRAAALAARSASGAGYPLGAPVPAVAVRLAGADGRSVPDGAVGQIHVAGAHVALASDGAVGQIHVAGAHVARAGDAAMDASDMVPAAAFAGDDGAMRWHAMGDMVYRAADGLWLVGRDGTALAGDGGAIWPGRVEAAAEALPFVRRAALVGLPARPPAGREALRAVLVVTPEPALAAHAASAAGRAALIAAWTAGLAREPSPPIAPFGMPDAPPRILVVPDLPMDPRHHARIDRAALRRRLLARELPANLALYFRERFSPLQYTLLILSYFSANFFLARAVAAPAAGGAWRFAAGATVLWLMFFHLRVVDEHKDAARDLVVHPDRILSRGLVTLPQLRWLGLAAVAGEVGLSAIIGTGALIGCALVLGLTALIARDFFLARFLERRMLVNAAVHMAIMPAYGLFGYAVATGRPPWAAPAIVLSYAWVGYGVGFALEIARKIRAPGDERPGLLTYSSALGPYAAAYAMLVALGAGGAVSLAVGRALGFAAWYHAAVAGLLIMAGVGVFDFRRRTDRSSAARLQAYASTFIIAYDALLVAALAQLRGLGPW